MVLRYLALRYIGMEEYYGYEVMPCTQAVLDVFPEKKKDGFDRVMDVAHLLMDGTVGTVCTTIDSVFQTYALMQGRKEARRIVKYTTSLEEARVKAAVEMRRLDLESQKVDNQYKLQNKVLTIYVEFLERKHFGNFRKDIVACTSWNHWGCFHAHCHCLH